ncbi:hypothetical protein ACFYXQ_09275 [Nocardia jiangxiensis]|uniref:Uncharacterized protein n=1 Tax=Nocardia jiangxiensis TaxID=282685 RepID=A0ABW6RVB0_9NOCA
MEPVSLGIAAAALLASKFGEGVAKDAGESTWQAAKRLRDVVASKLRNPESASAATASVTTWPAWDGAAVAARIAAAAEADSRFAAQIEQLIALARHDSAADLFVAQAFDQARQVNIGGDNTGTINLS